VTPGSRYRGFARVEQSTYAAASTRASSGPSTTRPRRDIGWTSRSSRRGSLSSPRPALTCASTHPSPSAPTETPPTERFRPSEEVELTHSGYDIGRAARDPDVVFPLALLRELASEGLIGELAPRAFSFMGYIPDTAPLLSETGPAVARELVADAADLVLLVPS
jgi:D-proline reductase (dithiol) PrdB